MYFCISGGQAAYGSIAPPATSLPKLRTRACESSAYVNALANIDPQAEAQTCQSLVIDRHTLIELFVHGDLSITSAPHVPNTSTVEILLPSLISSPYYIVSAMRSLRPMALVDYSDSEVEDDDKTQEHSDSPPAKKRRVSEASSNLPPLPQSFRNLYSSTVRTSTQDDPSLHGGRKRVTPHVPGNWPTHVYLEWSPSPEESDSLARLVSSDDKSEGKGRTADHDVRSLLQNDLGVPLPLHISLSRPLVLKTEQKDGFFNALKDAVSGSGVKSFKTKLEELQWHPNEDQTRWFLVLRAADESDELIRLLRACNSVAEMYGQPRLYEEDDHERNPHKKRKSSSREQESQTAKKFHISIAWSLQRPPDDGGTLAHDDIPSAIRHLKVHFDEVKVRIGQDVTSFSLGQKRRRSSVILG